VEQSKKKHPNEGLDLDKYDYRNMKGSMYNEYIDYVDGTISDPDDPNGRRVGGLDGEKQYVFEVYNVRPRTKKLYPQSKVDNTRVGDGFDLFSDRPVMVTKTFLKHARLQNTMLYANIGGANNNPIYYYLLQKPTH
jgi:hypothetical protein